MKPGWKTTEFWTTSFAQILALLAFIGVLTPSESQTLGEALGKAVAAVFTLFVNGTVVIHYVQSRLALKASAGKCHAIARHAHFPPTLIKYATTSPRSLSFNTAASYLGIIDSRLFWNERSLSFSSR